MAASFGLDIRVEGRRLPKHRNEFGEYVLSTPRTKYEIHPYMDRQEAQSEAVIEVFVDGISALCPPRRTRLLRNHCRVRGFELQRIELPNDGDTIEQIYEFDPFVFTFPQTDEDHNHPELGLIRIIFYEAVPKEVGGRRRRGAAADHVDPTVQPRQGKKSNGPERMTTKGGDRQLGAPVTLRSSPGPHTIYGKGRILCEVELRYYNGYDPFDERSQSSGSSSFTRMFSGSGNRLGGQVSREDALARFASTDSGVRVARVPETRAVPAEAAAEEQSCDETQIVLHDAAHDDDQALRIAIQMSLESSGMVNSASPSFHRQSDDEDADMQRVIEMAIDMSLQESSGSGAQAHENLSASTSTDTSHGHEQCFICNSPTKTQSRCRTCPGLVRWYVCQDCLISERNNCVRCKGRAFDVRTDSDLRSNYHIESSARSSHAPARMAGQDASCSPAQFYLAENDQAWDIEEEYSHPSWACAGTGSSENVGTDSNSMEAVLAEKSDEEAEVRDLNLAHSFADGIVNVEIPAHNDHLGNSAEANAATLEFDMSIIGSQEAVAAHVDGTRESAGLERSDRFQHPLENVGVASALDYSQTVREDEGVVTENGTVINDGVIGCWMLVAADWDATTYGEDYLCLQAEEWLRVLPGLSEGWGFAFSSRLNRYGWYPPEYAKQANTAAATL